MYCHQTGDILLKGVAKVVKKSVRKKDTYPKDDIDIPCRVGGEEFAFILPEASTVHSGVAPERLRAGLETRGVVILGERIRVGIGYYDFKGKKVTVIVGIASFPDHGTEMISLYKAADDAMYLAIKNGKKQGHHSQCRNRVTLLFYGLLPLIVQLA